MQAGEGDPSAQSGRKHAGRRSKKWWRDADPALVDPISLEPVCAFAKEPFRLGKTLFDGEILANYLVSTATFANPATREPLTREECQRLDEHLASVKWTSKSNLRVVEAYDLFKSTSAANKNQTEAMRREATILFQHLFSFRSRRQERRQRQLRSSERGFQIVDDDASDNFTTFEMMDFERDFPELFPVSSTRDTHQQSTSRLVRPAPRGGSLTASAPSRQEIQYLKVDFLSSDDEDDVPLFDGYAMDWTKLDIQTEGNLKQSNSEGDVEEYAEEQNEERNELPTNQVEQLADDIVESIMEGAGTTDDIAQKRAEAQIRALKNAGTTRSNGNRRAIPPLPKVAGPKQPSPLVSENKEEIQDETEVVAMQTPPLPSPNRRSNPPRGPCLLSIVGVILFISFIVCVLFWTQQVQMPQDSL